MDLPRRDGGRYEHVIIGFGERAIGPKHYDNLAPELRRRVDRRLKQLEAERVRDDPELEADFLSEFGTPMGRRWRRVSASGIWVAFNIFGG